MTHGQRPAHRTIVQRARDMGWSDQRIAKLVQNNARTQAMIDDHDRDPFDSHHQPRKAAK